MLNYITIPQPNELSKREREDAMGSYLMMFAAFAVGIPIPTINLIASAIYYYTNRKKSRFVHFHSLQSLLTQIPTTIINWMMLFWSYHVIFFENYKYTGLFYSYLAFTILSNLIYFVFSIHASIKSREGQFVYFSFIGPFIYSRVYSTKNTLYYQNEERSGLAPIIVNKPPFI
ncbi:DUF4870 domain-containing protein [Flavobacteriaceae bacterium]|uniref:DUF4870 domain-containing protein n=1 Tax=Candidatus Arcticimaribacter forsetii TaxID=2820661 RepID=UPI00207793B9|nr:DUF4870 domain-containing protein [Candidatus Arcticimaribacter forsetii]MDA8639822.1 DUF4870 domain-containing protein [Flavobacteriaceae bacterium]MDB2329645.1 DUF4870 domain-containing protein [Flavobacteriaceae bacterium]MDB2345893.1 DUF4870 domain-containing protein [Flavobacteriaceae bacterium]MDB2456508.1 DUF4870 domain-containing protein [Flavobacteriaceae bacterium]MDB4609262.1 DUF4870 domain-containing protein [Flavobacteriaceae bacterium]